MFPLSVHNFQHFRHLVKLFIFSQAHLLFPTALRLLGAKKGYSCQMHMNPLPWNTTELKVKRFQTYNISYV